ncbi:hypothetical protein BUALT_Bualt09G0125200 [Buddleja alternifolia]|uniref:RING-type domain-containing protein n=1 Tax=Buddleja alternifolia TaxID=168488 RepID=A0AAV6XCY3_9LAMI|nr:hypothetical protein BUALT_Bualt09G0125200 [Buddleja alternifolia]
MEQPPNGGEYSGDASGSAPSENTLESPPLPFPHRLPEYSRNSFHGDRFDAMNNEGSSVIGEDSRSCFVVVITFVFFVAMTLTFGVYASETLLLGPNSSILIRPNRLFVESIKVVELDAVKGSMLYGFYKDPPLDVMITWSETHKIALPASTHKEWIYYFNEGSQINISYTVNSLSSSSLVLVIAQGNEDLAEWLEDPSYPYRTSWNIIDGNGSIQKDVSKSSSYYIAVGNLHTEVVEAMRDPLSAERLIRTCSADVMVIQVHLNIGIEASLYNTTEPYYKCALSQGQCTFPLDFRRGNAAVLTSPGRKPGMVGGDWRVELSYGPRWMTYLIGIGGMTALVFLINYILNHFRHTEQDTRRDQLGDIGSERNPLLSHKDDNFSSQGSSYASLSGDEEHVEGAQEGKPIKDDEYSQRLCAICFDAPKDCFFLPCGHCVTCFGCATRIVEASGTCPICRRRTKKVRKIYTV